MERSWGSRFILKDCGPQKAHAGAGEKCEEEGLAGRNSHGLTTTPQFSMPLHHLGQEKVEE